MAYLFLGGTGAGACALLSALGLLVPSDAIAVPCARYGESCPPAPLACASGGGRAIDGGRALAIPRVYRRFMAPAYAAAFGCTALGALMLAFDLGAAHKSYLLFTEVHPTFLTFGAYVLAIQIGLSLALACLWGFPRRGLPASLMRALQVACLLVGLGVATYTGLLLSSMPAVPLWSNVCLPVLFVASSLSCGCALVLLCAFATGTAEAFGSIMRRMMGLDVVVMGVEALAAAGIVLLALGSSYEVAAQGASSLLFGRYALAFVLGFCIVGLVLPAVLELGSIALAKRVRGRVGGGARRRQAVAFAAAAAVLVGGFALRYCIVAAGMHPAVWAVLL